jgi:hypothetical protein
VGDDAERLDLDATMVEQHWLLAGLTKTAIVI